MNLIFLECFFLFTKLLFVFRKSATIQCARWAEKKHMFFVGNARSKSNARTHLKQRKKTWWPKTHAYI